MIKKSKITYNELCELRNEDIELDYILTSTSNYYQDGQYIVKYEFGSVDKKHSITFDNNKPTIVFTFYDMKETQTFPPFDIITTEYVVYFDSVDERNEFLEANAVQQYVTIIYEPLII